MTNKKLERSDENRLQILINENKEIEENFSQIVVDTKKKINVKLISNLLLSVGILGGGLILYKLFHKKPSAKQNFVLEKRSYNNSLYNMVIKEITLFLLSIAREKIRNFISKKD